MSRRNLLVFFWPLFFSSSVDVHAVQLRFQLKPGEEVTYRVSLAAAALAHVPMVEETMKMQMRGFVTLRQKVQRVEADGVMVVENRVQSGSLTMTSDGEEEKLTPPEQLTIVRMTRRGKILSIKRTSTPATDTEHETLNSTLGFDAGLLSAQGLIFPEEDIKAGDTWKEETTVDTGEDNNLTMKCSGKLVDLVEVMGYRCAKIRATIWLPADVALLNKEIMPSGDVETDIRGFTKNDLVVYFAYERGVTVSNEGAIAAMYDIASSMPTELEGADMGGHEMSISARLKMNIKTVLQQSR